MQDDVQKAFSAYQQALFYAPNSKDPYLWYGLGILYERHGSDNQAEEFFISALRCDPSFEKSSEIFYRLGIIFKNKKEFDKSIDCFQYILKKPPRPLTESDVKFKSVFCTKIRATQHQAVKFLTLFPPKILDTFVPNSTLLGVNSIRVISRLPLQKSMLAWNWTIAMPTLGT